jgi:hypothetical protein
MANSKISALTSATTPLAKGSTNGNSKLTESQVQIIRTQYENYGKKVLAAQYGVSVSLISQIVRKDIWKHV